MALFQFGTKASLIAKVDTSESCQACGTSFSVQLGVYQKYFYLLLIPFFPLEKTGKSKCSHCMLTLEDSQFKGPLITSFNHLRMQTKTPYWTFIGIPITFAFILLFSYLNKKNDESNAKYIESPKRGDIYEVKLSENEYTLYKVDKVINDTIFIFVNQFETDGKKGLINIKTKGNSAYSENSLPILRGSIKELFKKGEIIDVSRSSTGK